MSPFLANLVVGAILALVAWAIAFGVWVVKENAARKDDFHKLDKRLEGLEGKFVTQAAWGEFNRNFDQWKDKVLERIGHLGEQIAALTGKPSQ
jgi:tetrahydromethanopterin S-methyltransferase subunit G